MIRVHDESPTALAFPGAVWGRKAPFTSGGCGCNQKCWDECLAPAHILQPSGRLSLLMEHEIEAVCPPPPAEGPAWWDLDLGSC